ncbi:hypothetical protein BEN47_01215 [Hymenobacter lapidarius]|uniref:STAS/SEC14 domain-containing protein n=2 Tax=Hymenobacter lapidarius TaxID=1908237 RepID=A0A1G1T5R1_9BACT|nr:hypothetical protein BEN47_01215 [Hymenobacter lapidarius]
MDWRGEHNQDTTHAACLLMLQALQGRPCAKILNDNSNITHTTMTLTEWGLRWLEEMRNAGLEYIAWVLPSSLLARQAVENTVHYLEAPQVGTFDDVASAYVWLQQQQQQPVPQAASQA